MVLAGDQVIGTRRRRESLRRSFPDSLGVDMETAAVAQVCYQNKAPWAAVRIVSDGLNDGINPKQVLDYASSTATTVLRDIVLQMLGAPGDV
jgi:adenosylhomocysteine nucleosidase